MADKPDEAVLQLATAEQWAAWLEAHHGDGRAVWLRHAKQGAPEASVSHAEALEIALCYGWIDAVKKRLDGHYWLQRWTPRSARSIWSKVNRDKALALIADKRMRPNGLTEVQRAQQDGRWDAAYDPVSGAQVPPDLQAALDATPGAGAFFATLNSQNRYAILFRLQTAKKPDTRARRIAQFCAMLGRGETIYPQ